MNERITTVAPTNALAHFRGQEFRGASMLRRIRISLNRPTAA
jgi:hypothetical protein